MARSLLYRFGFLLYPKGEEPVLTPSDWLKSPVGDFELLFHPETAWIQIDDVIIIGLVLPIRGTVCQAVQSRKWDDLTGRFAAIILDQNPRVVQDAFGARTVFYRSGGAAIASHPGLLASAYGHGSNEAALELIRSREYRSRTVAYLPGLMTIHDGIRPLIPNHSLTLADGNIERIWPASGRVARSFEEFAAEFDLLLDAVALVPDPILGVTGGVDTRVLVAGLAARGKAIRTVTWSPPRIEDREIPIVKQTVDLLQLDHVWLTHEADVSDPIAIASGRNAGGFRGRAKITADTARLFTRGVFIRGYGGEIIRGFYNLRKRKMESADVGEMVDAYGSSMKAKDVGADYIRVVTAAFEEFSEICNYGDLRGFDPNDVFYWEHRMGVWGACMHNEMDAALYSMTGINSRTLFEKSYGLTDDERLTKELLNRIVVRSIPQMGSVNVI